MPHIMQLKILFYLKRAAISSLLCFCSCYSLGDDGHVVSTEITLLESEFNKLTTQLYNDRTHISKSKTAKDFNISELANLIDSDFSQGKYLAASQRLINDADLITTHINHPASIQILSTLLEYDTQGLATKLLNMAHKRGDNSTLFKMHYIFAVYYAERNNWLAAQKHLTQIEAQDSLTTDESDYATLLFGISLQRTKNHRAAVTYYEKIPHTSPYYQYAQLNKAAAYIRQGWWTDAQISIEDSLKQTSPPPLKEVTNRLYLVLGYSQLRHEFYRDARNSFRKVTLGSQYKNRALLGIGLSALNQKDYIGAINAFGRLKSQQESDISTTESYLLSAYTHEQMKQISTASDQYSEAINYYQQKIATINNSPPNETSINSLSHHTHKTINRLKNQIKITSTLLEQIENHKLAKPLITLNKKHTELLAKIQKNSNEQDIKILTSYLSQAQFGQAKLYDDATR